MHSFQSLFSSSGPSKVSRSFNRDKFPRRDAFPPPLPESRKRRRQSELQIEKYIIRTSHNFYDNLSQIFLFMYFYRDGWSRPSAAIAQFEEHNRKISRFLSIIAYSYLFYWSVLFITRYPRFNYRQDRRRSIRVDEVEAEECCLYEFNVSLIYKSEWVFSSLVTLISKSPSDRTS